VNQKNKKSNTRCAARLPIQLVRKLVFPHQFAHKIVGEIYTKAAEDTVKAPFGKGK
jgi:hypothetical protein